MDKTISDQEGIPGQFGVPNYLTGRRFNVKLSQSVSKDLLAFPGDQEPADFHPGPFPFLPGCHIYPEVEHDHPYNQWPSWPRVHTGWE